ncbi:hypothetical protein B484DRAFT_117594 [Ochromonadaceae sp. CCMP2298]|nr:hypothetical protein B484DRAFT_117594 [Ochromonadaceae sp. CCMP2298]
MLTYWDSDPNIPTDAGSYGSGRGVYAMNETDGKDGDPYHDTTGRTTWGEDRRIFAVSQTLFSDTGPSLGYNLYSSSVQGEAIDRMVQCVEKSSYDRAGLDCGTTTAMMSTGDSSAVTSHRSVPVVVGNSSSHEIVGLIDTQYRWGPTLSKIFETRVTGKYVRGFNTYAP